MLTSGPGGVSPAFSPFKEGTAMTEQETHEFLAKIVDGQQIRISLIKSGRTMDGIYDGEQSSLEAGLYFETLDGQVARAEWQNIAAPEFRSARMTAGRMMVPPEHPLSGQHPAQRRADGVPLRPHTARNR